MKTNAIIRIIIWSLVIVLLVSILGGTLLLRGYRHNYVSTEATAVPRPLNETPAMPVEDNQQLMLEASVAATAVNIRSAPNSDSSIVGMLKQNDTVYITRQENIGGEAWAFITHPNSGWVKAEFLSVRTAVPTITDQGISLDAKQIREIEIEWVAGSITLMPADVDTIQVAESDPAESKYAMVWKQSGDKLVIRFCENAKLDFNFGITINDVIYKDLTILVPMDWECDSLEVAAASATLDVRNLLIKEVDFDGASGECRFENCVINELDLDTASGDVFFTGSLKSLDCDAASASVTAVFSNVPSRIDMDSMSGDLDITLPTDSGFTVSMSALSSNFHSDFDYSLSNSGYRHGDGSCRISMDAVSGDLYIRQQKTTEPAPEIPQATEAHHHTDSCTTDPESCPENAVHHTEPHQHSDSCTTNPDSCPDNETHHTEAHHE